MFTLFLFACASPYDGGDATAGATVYADVCEACHGADGHGISGSGIDLQDSFGEGEIDEIADVILNGTGEMPAQDLTDTEVADVIAYGMTLF